MVGSVYREPVNYYYYILLLLSLFAAFEAYLFEGLDEPCEPDVSVESDDSFVSFVSDDSGDSDESSMSDVIHKMETPITQLRKSLL